MSEEVEDEQAVTWLTFHEVLDRSALTYRALQDLAEQGVVRTRQSGGTTLFCGEDVESVER